MKKIIIFLFVFPLTPYAFSMNSESEEYDSDTTEYIDFFESSDSSSDTEDYTKKITKTLTQAKAEITQIQRKNGVLKEKIKKLQEENTQLKAKKSNPKK